MNKFVLQVPRWRGELLFSRELLLFLGVILLMVVGTLFCFWGYKYFKTVLFVGIGTVICYIAYLLVEPLTKNLVIRLFLTVSLTFLGVCFVYFLDIIFGYILDRLQIRRALSKRTYLLAAPLGAAVLGLTIYNGIWRDAVVAAVISAVCLICGLLFQRERRKKQVRFCCYSDLLRLKYPNLQEDGLEYITLDSAAMPADTAAKAEAEEGTEELSDVVAKAEAKEEPEELAVAEAEAEVEKAVDIMKEEEKLESAPAEAEPERAETIGAVPVPGEKSMFVPVAEMQIKPLSMSEEMETTGDGTKYLLFRKPEQESDLLEDAVFMRQVKSAMEAERCRKQIDMNMAVLAAARYAKRAAIKDESSASADKVSVSAARETGQRKMQAVKKREIQRGSVRKMRRKQGKKIAQAVAVTAAGFSLFFAGRASKGRD